MVQLAHDFTGDGWPDVLNMSGNAGNGTGTLFVNPKGESRRWDRFVVMQPPDHVIGNEETLLKDVNHDGRMDIVHTGQGTMRYSTPDPANPTGTWITTTISEPGPWGVNISHGMGIGDIDGDGLNDYVSAYGWWKQPAKGQRDRHLEMRCGSTTPSSSLAGARHRAAPAARRWASTTSTATSSTTS